MNFRVPFTVCGLCMFLFAGCGYSPPVPITRADAIRSLWRFDKTFLAASLTPDQTLQVNAQFDQGIFPIGLGLNSEAVANTNQTWSDLIGGDESQPPRSVLISLMVGVEPRAGGPGQVAPTATVESIYPGAFSPGTLDVVLRVRAADQSVVSERTVSLALSGDTRLAVQTPLLADGVSLPVGVYALELAVGNVVEPVGNYSVLPGVMADIRAANEAALANVSAPTPALQQALATAKQRNSLLIDHPTGSRLYELLVDPQPLVADLATEIAALQGGVDPYINKTGDYWRVLSSSAGDIPMRVYLSPTADTTSPISLVVAYHGTGGDENVLVEAYGAGIIKTLAEQKKFLLVAPVTDSFIDHPEMFDALLTALRYDYNIGHVYVVGHSLGAHLAAALARTRISVLSAACGIAGGQDFNTADALAPLLIFAGGSDTMQPPDRLGATYGLALAKGLPVQFRVKPGLGHTLLVGAAMPEAIDFLLAH